MDKLYNSIVMVPQKGGSLKKILGWIAAYRQFRKDHQAATSLPGKIGIVSDLVAIAGKVADHRIGLGQSYFHVVPLHIREFQGPIPFEMRAMDLTATPLSGHQQSILYCFWFHFSSGIY